LPPLRERENDVLILSKHFLRAFCEQNKIQLKTFSKSAIEAMMKHNWPGNIRELKSFVERAALISETNEIGIDDLIFSATIVDY
jgi:DNA-binding NtrC family response regulator